MATKTCCFRQRKAAVACCCCGEGGGGLAGEEAPAAIGGRCVPVAQYLVRRVASLTEDDSENVRTALAVVATDLAPALGKDATLAHLLPPMLLLLWDASSEVGLNVVSSLSRLNDVIECPGLWRT